MMNYKEIPWMSDNTSTRNKKQISLAFVTKKFGPREIDNLASVRKLYMKILENKC